MRALDISPSVVGDTGDPTDFLSPSVVDLAIPGGRYSQLSRELHDGVGQSITSLLVDIRVAIERGHATRDDLLVIERQTEEVLGALRALAYQVRRRAPLVDPFAQARVYAERLVAASGATLRWSDNRLRRRLAARVATELAGSIRESVTNAIAHGRARLVEVRLTEADGRIRITVRDDGVGFEPESLHPTPDGHGLGLLGTAERMAEIGGLFTVRSRFGEGTVVALEVPRFSRRKIVPGPLATVAQPVDPEQQRMSLAAG